MDARDEQTTPYARQSRTLRWLWLALTVILLLAILGKAALDRRGTTRFGVLGLDHSEAAQVQQDWHDELILFRDSARQERRTLEEFESKFRLDEPASTSDDGRRLTYRYPPPFTLEAEVEIRDDESIRIRGFGHGGIGRTTTDSLLIENLASRLATFLGGPPAPLCLLPWLGIMLWPLIRRRHTQWAAIALAAWITFCLILFLMPPNYPLTIDGMMSNDRLAWIVVMLVVGLPALMWMLTCETEEWWRCRGCGYNLHRNGSGTCPECGREIPHATRSRLRSQLKQPN